MRLSQLFWAAKEKSFPSSNEQRSRYTHIDLRNPRTRMAVASLREAIRELSQQKKED
jgi:hypothetical protein